jgi:hypothetical protein
MHILVHSHTCKVPYAPWAYVAVHSTNQGTIGRFSFPAILFRALL